MRLVGRDELRTLVPSERYTSAIYDSNSGHLQPYKFTLGLATAGARAGVKICENSWVTKLDLAAVASEPSLTASSDSPGDHVDRAGVFADRVQRTVFAPAGDAGVVSPPTSSPTDEQTT